MNDSAESRRNSVITGLIGRGPTQNPLPSQLVRALNEGRVVLCGDPDGVNRDFIRLIKEFEKRALAVVPGSEADTTTPDLLNLLRVSQQPSMPLQVKTDLPRGADELLDLLAAAQRDGREVLLSPAATMLYWEAAGASPTLAARPWPRLMAFPEPARAFVTTMPFWEYQPSFTLWENLRPVIPDALPAISADEPIPMVVLDHLANVLRDWAGLDLSEAQVRALLTAHPDLEEELREEGGVDTVVREKALRALARDLLRRDWPTFGDDEDDGAFASAFDAAARQAGYRVVADG